MEMNPLTPPFLRQRWIWAIAALVVLAGGLALLTLPDDAHHRALADLEQQNEARRNALAARDRERSGQNNPGPPEFSAAALQAEPATGPARPPVNTADLIRRIDRLSADLARLEQAALNLDRRIVQSKLDVNEELIAKQTLHEMENELEKKNQYCLDLAAKGKKIAEAAHVQLPADFFDANTILPPELQNIAGLAETRSQIIQNKNLLTLLIQRFAQTKLGVPPNR
jgi:hypothetical protein